MASSSSTANVPSPPILSENQDQDLSKPLWKYVTRTNKMDDGGGNCTWICNFCHQTKKSSYTRVRAHFLKIPKAGIGACPKVRDVDLVEMQKPDEQATERMESSAPKKVSLPRSSTTNVIQGQYDYKRRRTSGSIGSSSQSNPILKGFNIQARDTLHASIARMFYSAGLPFHLARNPYYVHSYSFAANNSIPGYLPPGYNLLRTTLLQQEKAHVERKLQPIKSTWSQNGVSIVSDGWSDSQRRPLINVMAMTEGGPMFLKAIDCSGEIKDKHFIANILKEVIEEVGPDNIIQLVTDNAKNCAGAGALVSQIYPHFTWTPCVVHTLNLALQNICLPKNSDVNEVTYIECSWITNVHDDIMFVKNFIMNHSMRLAMFNEFVPLKLLSVANTRFASVIVMMKRFKLIKRGLQELVISEQWSTYREDDVGKAQVVKETLLNDLWWDKIDYIISFTGPIYDMLRRCDTDKPCLHLVYEMWDSMIEQVKVAIFRKEGKQLEESSSFYDVIYKILIDRWTKNYTPLYCLAHSLNPKCYTQEWINEVPGRVPPHKDLEISQERSKCLKKFFPNPTDRVKVNMEFANFSTNAKEFGDSDSIYERYHMDPKAWWVIHGASAPMLQSLALKLLQQPSSSFCCERNWSTYSFIHSLKRNKLAPKRAEDLVFVHSNLRLLSRRDEDYFKGRSKMWDICGDTFESFEDVGELAIANLSLDEPEIEAVIFTDDGDNVLERDDEEIQSNEAEDE